jgi:exodeoxyribonuclease VII small subunit
LSLLSFLERVHYNDKISESLGNAMNKPISFEKSLAELEEIVRILEKGELALDASLKQFEKGMGLARKCEEILTEASQKVDILTAFPSPDFPEKDLLEEP